MVRIKELINLNVGNCYVESIIDMCGMITGARYDNSYGNIMSLHSTRYFNSYKSRVPFYAS